MFTGKRRADLVISERKIEDPHIGKSSHATRDKVGVNILAVLGFQQLD